MHDFDLIKERLIYDPVTGIFTRRHRDGMSAAWNARFSGKPTGSLHKSLGYLTIGIDGCLFYAHRLAVLYMTGQWPSHDVDHVDGNRLNNAWTNLRCATKSQNGANRPLGKANKSGFKGVSWSAADRRWVASIGHNGATVRIGSFMTPEEAHEAYVAKAADLQGEFAHTDAARAANAFPGADGAPKLKEVG